MYMLAMPQVAGGENGFDLDFLDSANIRSILVTSSGISLLSGGVSYHDNIWHHFVSTYDGATHITYYDGRLLISGAHTGTIKNAEDEVNFGRFSGTRTNAYTGLLDDGFIYNRALSPSEIQSLYSLGRGGIFQRKARFFGTAGDAAEAVDPFRRSRFVRQAVNRAATY